jgi:hypothetical protein
MGSAITMEKARKALDKLKAVDISTPKDAHPTFGIYDKDGVMVATTGLRRSSKKDIKVGHVPKDLNVNQHFVLGLANCPISRDQYLAKVAEKSGDSEIADQGESSETDASVEQIEELPKTEPKDNE